ncbi:MAG: cyclic nucleotide-binding domain-containing protein [Verrucomicrobiota bacterium]
MDIDILANIPLFAKLSPEELTQLAGLLQAKTIDPQKPVFWIGDPGSDFFIIQVGRASVCFPDEAGHEVTLATLGPGDFFGEISLLDGGPAPPPSAPRTN